MTGHLIVTDEDAERVITLRRPEKKNAITQDMYRAMSEAIDTAQNNRRSAASSSRADPACSPPATIWRIFSKTAPRIPTRRAPPTPSSFCIRWPTTPSRSSPRSTASRSASAPRMLFHCDYVLASTTSDLLHAVHPSRSGAGRRLQPADAARHGTPARLCHAGDGPHGQRRGGPRGRFRQYGGRAGSYRSRSPQGGARNCALPAEAVAISRKLLKLPPEDLTRRIDQESHLFGERMRSTEAVAAFKAFFARKKG